MNERDVLFYSLLLTRVLIAQLIFFYPSEFFRIVALVFAFDFVDAVFTYVNKRYKIMDWVADLLSCTPLMIYLPKVMPFFDYYPVYWFFNCLLMMFIAYDYMDFVLFKAPTYVILTSYITHSLGFNSNLIYLSFILSPVLEWYIHIWKRPKWFPTFVETKMERGWKVFKTREQRILAFLSAMMFQGIIAKLFIRV